MRLLFGVDAAALQVTEFILDPNSIKYSHAVQSPTGCAQAIPFLTRA